MFDALGVVDGSCGLRDLVWSHVVFMQGMFL